MSNQGERRRAPRHWKTARDALFRLFRFLAAHIRGFHGPVFAFILIGLVGVAAIVMFAVWARFVMRGTTEAFDSAVLTWFAHQRNPRLDGLMLEITSLGNTVTITILLVVACLFLWLTQHKYSVYLLLIGIVGGSILNNLLKLVFDRPRPQVVEWVSTVQVHTRSFPSGHSMTALIAYGSVAYLVGRLEPTPRLRVITWVITAIVVISIGISRVYLGVHYPSDVIAGFILGLAWLMIVTSGVTAMQFFAERKPDVREAEHDLDAEDERAAGVRS